MIVEENVGDQGDEHNPQEKNRAEEREICKNEGRSRVFTAEKILDILEFLMQTARRTLLGILPCLRLAVLTAPAPPRFLVTRF